MIMKSSPFEFANRLWAFLREELSDQEAEQLQDVVKEYPEIGELMNDLEDKNKISKELAVLEVFDTEKALRKLYLRSGVKRHRLHWFGVIGTVAALVVLISTIFILYRYDEPESDLSLVENRVGGFARVLLQTADGQIYGLDTLVTSIVNQQEVTFDNGEGILNVSEGGSDGLKNQPERKNIVQVPYGGTYILRLQDSTRVYLNSGSSLEFPSLFAKSERRVKISGEVYFEVTHDDKRPFIIEVEDAQIRVLGTSFNVKAYPEEEHIYTTLVEGKVGFTEDSGENRILTPGQQLIFEKRNGKMFVVPVNTQLYTAWKDGLFWFQDTALEDILKIVGRWYDLEIFYVNPEVKDIQYSGKMRMYSAVEDILRKFEKSGEVYFSLKGRTLTVYRK